MKYIKALLLILLMTSCSINGSFQGLYSYYNKTEKEIPNLFLKHQMQCENFIRNKIYITTGKKLQNCLQKNSENLIYFWSPKCKSDYCYSLDALQKECIEKKINLYIVAEYYDTELMNLEYRTNNPIFGIDTNYYKTNLTSKYISKFLLDLNTNKEFIENRFFYFQNDNYIKNFKSIEEINYLIRE